MLRLLIGFFIVLHGLVHMWYFTLSQRLVEFQPEMGWTGKSWLFSNFVQSSHPPFLGWRVGHVRPKGNPGNSN